MPVSKLWLEHTERAAWDSVEALRERLVKAEGRLQTLAPNVNGLQRLLDMLEQAKQRLNTTAQGHDEIVAELLERLDATSAELKASKVQTPIPVNFGSPDNARFDWREPDDSDDDGDALEDEPDISDFARTMQRRHAGAIAEPPLDLDRLLALAETKLDDLAELEGSSLREAAVELALIAARIHASSRRKTR